jgi:hypothetical protein
LTFTGDDVDKFLLGIEFFLETGIDRIVETEHPVDKIVATVETEWMRPDESLVVFTTQLAREDVSDTR